MRRRAAGIPAFGCSINGRFDIGGSCGPPRRSANRIHRIAEIDSIWAGSCRIRRGTYEPARAAGIVSPYAHLEQYVVSTTLDRIDDPQIELVRTDPVELVRRLEKEEGPHGKDICLCGGGTLAGALIDESDQLVFKSYPVLAGTGVPVLGGAFRPARFTPVQRREFGNGARVTWFERV